MKDVDDLDIKAEIDEISKKIDAIIENIEDSETGRGEGSDENQD